MIIQKDLIQGSEQWFAVRKGRATASEFHKILTPAGYLSNQAKAYMRKLTRECVCADPQEFMGNKHTERGEALEPEARDFFAARMGMTLDQVGFIGRGDGAPLGCSPDSLIVDPNTGEYIGGLEIKCPQVDNHVAYLMDGELPNKYRLQVHGSMVVTGLPFWYFLSYHPELRPLIVKVERDAFTEKVAAGLDQFLIAYAEERERVLSVILEEEAEEEPVEEEPKEMEMVI